MAGTGGIWKRMAEPYTNVHMQEPLQNYGLVHVTDYGQAAYSKSLTRY